MTEASTLNLRAEFPPVPVEAWEAQIKTDLKGADYEKRLVWKTDEGLRVMPYYALVTAPEPRPPVHGGGWKLVEPGSMPPADVDATCYQDAGSTTVEELAFALAEAVEVYAAVPKPLIVRFAAGPVFFLELAKFRAARMLWAHAARVFGAPESHARLTLHALTARWNKTLYDENSNLLRATCESLAAVAGGCDLLTVRPELFDARLALNIGRILREESHLDKVADPGAGSYYIEALTELLAREAWARFLDVEAEGGFARYHALGKVDAAVAASRAAKDQLYAQRRRVLVGVNNYPNANEQALDRSYLVPPVDDTTALPLWRASGVFERLRLRTEQYAKKTGRRPKVALLERGDVKMRRARATFCANFFGCAGFEITSGKGDLAVLCSSDAEYPELAKAMVPGSDVPVLVAGNPKEHIEQLKAAGVAGFVHLASNLVDTLTEWQHRLGVTA